MPLRSAGPRRPADDLGWRDHQVARREARPTVRNTYPPAAVFLGRLAAKGHSLLIVEQYLTKALALADFLYVLVRVAFAGEPGEADDADILRHSLGAAAV